jgi:glucose-1-phosphate cytidylyltransferase
MKAVILCGGLGTRIRDANESLPKPMLPIGGKPIVWHIMKIYASYGVRDFVLCLGYKSWMFKEWFLNYKTMTADITVNTGRWGAVDFHSRTLEDDWRVTLAETGEETMTGGRVAAIRRYIDPSDDLFFVTYGDGVADVDLEALARFHRSHGKVATVTAVRPPSRFGEMEIRQGHVRAFTEKPQVTQGAVNGGFFVFDAKRIWDYLPQREDLILEREPLQRLAKDEELAAFDHDGFWQPMDTLREFNYLNSLWDQGQAAWRCW